MTEETLNMREIKLADELKRLMLVVESTGRAILPLSNDELLQSIVEAAAHIFGAGGASIALVDRDQKGLEFKYVYGEARDSLIGMRIPISQGVVGYVAMTGQPMAISNVEQNPHFAQEVAEKVRYQPRSILAMPLISNDRVIGVIEIIDKVEEEAFGMNDMELLGIFAGQAALAIHAAQQYELLDEGLVLALRGLANAEHATTLDQVLLEAGSFVSDPARAEVLELARLFGLLAGIGERERRACLQVLRAFSEYVQSEPTRG